MLVEKIYTVIFFLFLQDVIDFIFGFCVGYFFSHFFFYIFIQAMKKNSTKDIADFFEKYKQRMAERPNLEEEFKSLAIQTEKPTSLEVVDPRKEFFFKLDQKVSDKFKDCIIEIDVSEKLLRFSFESRHCWLKSSSTQLMIISKRNFFYLMGWRNWVSVQNTCYTTIFLLDCQTDLKRK